MVLGRISMNLHGDKRGNCEFVASQPYRCYQNARLILFQFLCKLWSIIGLIICVA